MFATSAALIVAFAVIEPRLGERALVPASVMRNRTFAAACVGDPADVAPCSSCSSSTCPSSLIKILGYTPLEAGLGLLPMMGMFAITSFFAARLYERFGPKIVISAGRGADGARHASCSRFQTDADGYSSLVAGPADRRHRRRPLPLLGDDGGRHRAAGVEVEPRRRHRLHVPDRRRRDRPRRDHDAVHAGLRGRARRARRPTRARRSATTRRRSCTGSSPAPTPPSPRSRSSALPSRPRSPRSSATPSSTGLDTSLKVVAAVAFCRPARRRSPTSAAAPSSNRRPRTRPLAAGVARRPAACDKAAGERMSDRAAAAPGRPQGRRPARQGQHDPELRARGRDRRRDGRVRRPPAPPRRPRAPARPPASARRSSSPTTGATPSRASPHTLGEVLEAFTRAPLDTVEIDCDLKLPGREQELVDGLREHGLIERAMVSTMYVESLIEIRGSSRACAAAGPTRR